MKIEKTMNKSNHIIRSNDPASEWAEGYPVGNGRLGGMVIGDPARERITLNHDRLWRNFWSFQEHGTAADLPQLRSLIAAGLWDEAHDLLKKKVPVSSHALYLNPFVPVCDLGIYPFLGHSGITEYYRELDLDKAIAEVSFVSDGVRYRRECFSSWTEGALVIRLSASQAGRVRGQVTLSRFLDPDCVINGRSSLGQLVLEGTFEEGVRFATVVRIVQRGGRLTGTQAEYIPPSGALPPLDLNGGQFIFRELDYPHDPIGVSTGFDSADEVLLLVTIATEDETTGNLVEWCDSKLRAIDPNFERLRSEHIANHQKLYRRASLSLESPAPAASMAELIEMGRHNNEASPSRLIEYLFNIGRYLAIASGRPVPKDQPPKAPINLQGLWNQDRRPPWDSDYHLDLNLQMCYWPLPMANLGELMEPMADWFLTLLPQARRAAQDLYGCRGAVWSPICDLRHIGNVDDICYPWTGAGAWVAQVLWQHWEYSKDIVYLREKLYPLLKEVGEFYEDYLIMDEDGRLVPVPSASPEMGIKGRIRYSTLSSPSSMDLELIHETFSNLLRASEVLAVDESKRAAWSEVRRRVPLPFIDKDECLQEWIVAHEPIDVGHRHRSPMIGISPGDRITSEDTPDYFAAARKLLDIRQSDRASTCAFACIWDAHLLARFYDGDAALRELALVTRTWLMDNALLSICDWHPDATTLNWFPDRKVFQIEASIGAVASITEMLFQDRRGLLRLLPALPRAWPKGEIKGLRSRGGFLVDIAWEDSELVNATIHSLRGEVCRIKCHSNGRALRIFRGSRAHPSNLNNGEVQFASESGETYTVQFEPL